MINLKNNQGFKWKNEGNIFFKGYIDSLNSNENGIKLSEYITDENQLIEKLKKSNGFFSIIVEEENYVFAAVDRLRSIPLFYAVKHNEFYLSDDAHWIREKIADEIMDDVSINEFYLTGYVTGKDTLYPNIKQIQAGEYLIFNRLKNTITTQYYFQLKHENYFSNTNEELIEKLDKIHVDVFQRLIDSLENRTAVIPLSGGYDSRLIAIMLKRLGYDNVICFSYGKENNTEALISKSVAEKLGYRWIFVEYTNEKWINWFHSEDKIGYYDYADGLSSIPHIQDVIAVKELMNKGAIPTDSIFIPGHALDFLAGSHIPQSFLKKKKANLTDITHQLLTVHYSLWEDEELLNNYHEHFEVRIKKIIDKKEFYTNDEAIDNYERWIWSQRQAKFIAHSVRVYDYYGYEWRMPLWEKEIINFWERVNIDNRFNRKLFLEYVEHTQPDFNYLQTSKKKNFTFLKNLIKNTPLLNKWLIKFIRINSISQHSLSWYSIILDEKLPTKRIAKMSNINSYLTYKYLKCK